MNYNGFSAEKIRELLDNSVRYKETIGANKRFIENEEFRLGEQWPPLSENSKVKSFPRVVLNICDYIIQHKTSGIQSQNMKMTFRSFDDSDVANIFTKFTETEWERLKMDNVLSDLLDTSATTGIGVLYFFIEPNVIGQSRIKCEEINPINFHVGNPKENDVQKQSHIIIVQRLPLEDVLKMAETNGLKVELKDDKEIIGGSTSTTNRSIDIDGIEKVNLLTIFYRGEDGYVRFRKVCGEEEIQEETNLQIRKYPFATYQWTNKSEAFYSKGEIDHIKNNQRAINTLQSLTLMNQQLAMFPKMWAKQNSININSIKNVPGEVLIDKSQTPGVQFGWLQPNPINNLSGVTMETLVNSTKMFNGVYDVDTGAGSGGSDSATGILALQKKAGIQMDKLRKKYIQLIEDLGLIWKEMYCEYYIIDRNFRHIDEKGREQVSKFNAREVDADTLDLKIEVGATSTWSQEFSIMSLDKFLQGGMIDFKTYLKYIPDNVVPFKDELLKDIEIKEKEQAQEAQDYILSQLTPSERAVYNQLPPEIQQQVLLSMTKKQEQLGKADKFAVGGGVEPQQ